MTPFRALECKTPPQTRGRLCAHENNNRADKKLEFDHQTFDDRVAEGWFVPSFRVELAESGWIDYAISCS